MPVLQKKMLKNSLRKMLKKSGKRDGKNPIFPQELFTNSNLICSL